MKAWQLEADSGQHSTRSASSRALILVPCADQGWNLLCKNPWVSSRTYIEVVDRVCGSITTQQF